MTAPTPKRPLDVEALLRRLRGLSSILDDAPTDGEADDAAAAFVLHRPAILAALAELEGLRTAIQTALDKLVPEGYIICRGCGRMGFHEPACLVPGLETALAAREAEEVSGG